MRGLSLYHFLAHMRANIDQGSTWLRSLFCCDLACKRHKFLDHLELKLEKCNPRGPTKQQLKHLIYYIHAHRCQFSAWGVTKRFEESYLDALHRILVVAQRSEKLVFPAELDWYNSIHTLRIDRWLQVGVMSLSAPKGDDNTGWDSREGLLFPDEWSSGEGSLSEGDVSESEAKGYRLMATP
ncbi:MAG: hypothetical protein P1U63_00500 [Coxiellaceae bacterium]|nr:hypothetical protein [Coxiellaceae bacterium]